MTSTRAPLVSPENLDPRRTLLEALAVEERRLVLARISTPALEGGAGPPLVLLHGPGGNATHWMRVIPALLRGHRVIAPDLPGHGASEVGEVRLDAERVLAWLDELIEQTCASPPVLIGQHLGGAIAARFAIRQPARLRQLVLIDTFGLTDFQPAPEFGLALTEFFAHPTAPTHQKLWQQCAHDLAALRERMGALWQPFEAYNVDRARTPALANALAALMANLGAKAIPTTELARLTTPTTLIWGRHDRATPLSVAKAASVRFGWPLHVIESCNDDPPIEQPEALARVLASVLDIAGRGPGPLLEEI